LFAFVALGMLGVSFGGIFAFAYVALPVYAATRLASNGEAPDERQGVLSVIRWFAAICAWAALTTERLPARRPNEQVKLEIDVSPARPTAGSAIARVITGLPSALVLALLCALP
jgi:cobalamin synthase